MPCCSFHRFPLLVHALGREPEHLYATREQVRQAAAAAGRDPDALTYTCNIAVLGGEQAAPRKGQIAGSPEAISEQLRELAQSGFTWLNFWTGGEEEGQRERIAREIIPTLRA
jgi:alkanesulfonate monooxygenase SsuD/methylene tetrahydromethanopterin reductase-like flavin-dependent oxidoreductase (luciferase family)